VDGVLTRGLAEDDLAALPIAPCEDIRPAAVQVDGRLGDVGLVATQADVLPDIDVIKQ
jgi:hypothetical protein